MLGLAAIAALASMALIGATSASADSLCTESGHHASECPAAKIYKGNVLGLTLPGKPALLLENGKIKEECHSQVLGLGSTITNEGSHKGMKILIDTGALTFTKCTGLCSNAESTRPAWLLLNALTLDAFVSPDEVLLSGARLFNCLFNIECEYEFTSDNQLMSIGEIDTITASSVPLKKSGGSALCPNNVMSFDATWLTTKDEEKGTAISVAALP